MTKRKCITETAAFLKRIETEWGRDILPVGMLKEMGVNMGHARTLARLGHIRLSV